MGDGERIDGFRGKVPSSEKSPTPVREKPKTKEEALHELEMANVARKDAYAELKAAQEHYDSKLRRYQDAKERYTGALDDVEEVVTGQNWFVRKVSERPVDIKIVSADRPDDT